MTSRKVRDFSKRGDAIPVPELTHGAALDAYQRFIQKSDKAFDDQRDPGSVGLESLCARSSPSSRMTAR